jgi:hypothetical protein
MTVTNDVILSVLGSITCLQVWQVRQIFEIRQSLALLRQDHKSLRRSVGGILVVAVLPWLLLFTGCTQLDRFLLQPATPGDTNALAIAHDGEATSFNLEVRDEIRRALETGQAVAPLLPPPYNVAVAPALAGVSVLLTWYARARSKEAQKALRQLTATVRGVERLHGDKAPLVKRFIREASEALGVEEELHKTVKQITER